MSSTWQEFISLSCWRCQEVSWLLMWLLGVSPVFFHTIALPSPKTTSLWFKWLLGPSPFAPCYRQQKEGKQEIFENYHQMCHMSVIDQTTAAWPQMWPQGRQECCLYLDKGFLADCEAPGHRLPALPADTVHIVAVCKISFSWINPLRLLSFAFYSS